MLALRQACVLHQVAPFGWAQARPAKLAGGEYKFACTFPGHGALMNGKVTLVD